MRTKRVMSREKAVILSAAQKECQEADRLAYAIKDTDDRTKLRTTVADVYKLVRKEDLPELTKKVKQLTRLYNELNIRR